MRSTLRYVGSAVEFDEYRLHLKSVPCPHCRAVGNLNRHGYLRGYAEEGDERIVRGWRIFCSNRHRRKGCGRTHSVLLGGFLSRRLVNASRLWEFLDGILLGLKVKAAWEKVSGGFTLECGYRLWKKFRTLQHRLRSLLCRMGNPKPSVLKDPFFQGIEHLKSLFPGSACPVTAFQLHFQRPFPV